MRKDFVEAQTEALSVDPAAEAIVFIISHVQIGNPLAKAWSFYQMDPPANKTRHILRQLIHTHSHRQFQGGNYNLSLSREYDFGQQSVQCHRSKIIHF